MPGVIEDRQAGRRRHKSLDRGLARRAAHVSEIRWPMSKTRSRRTLGAIVGAIRLRMAFATTSSRSTAAGGAAIGAPAAVGPGR